MWFKQEAGLGACCLSWIPQGLQASLWLTSTSLVFSACQHSKSHTPSGAQGFLRPSLRAGNTSAPPHHRRGPRTSDGPARGEPLMVCYQLSAFKGCSTKISSTRPRPKHRLRCITTGWIILTGWTQYVPHCQKINLRDRNNDVSLQLLFEDRRRSGGRLSLCKHTERIINFRHKSLDA